MLSLFSIVVTVDTSAIEYVELLAKKEGTLFTSSTVSHFVGCSPVSYTHLRAHET